MTEHISNLFSVTYLGPPQYNTIQYNTIQYNTIQYNTIQYFVYTRDTKELLSAR